MIGRHTLLFLCRDNAGLSLMAEALAIHLAHRLKLDVRAFSAAAQTTAPVDVVALECLHEAGVPADGLSSKPLELFALSGAPRVDVVVPLVPLASRVTVRQPWLHGLRQHHLVFEDVGVVAEPHLRRKAYRALLPALRQTVLDLVPRAGFAPDCAAA